MIRTVVFPNFMKYSDDAPNLDRQVNKLFNDYFKSNKIENYVLAANDNLYLSYSGPLIEEWEFYQISDQEMYDLDDDLDEIASYVSEFIDEDQYYYETEWDEL